MVNNSRGTFESNGLTWETGVTAFPLSAGQIMKGSSFPFAGGHLPRRALDLIVGNRRGAVFKLLAASLGKQLGKNHKYSVSGML